MDQSSDLRRSRVRKFLITHGILCGLAFLMTSIETLLGAQAEVGDIVRSYLVSVIAGAMTVAGFALYHRPALTNVIAPIILAVDSTIVLIQIFWEAGLESGWAATPILLTVLMPLYTDDRRLIFGLTGYQLLLYVAVFGVRALGWIDYETRPPHGGTLLYSGLGYAFVVVGAAIFAGQASLDVLNSQERLQREVDQATSALRKAQAQIVQQAKMAGLGQLTAGVAHEINNPLTFVQTNLTSIERDLADVLRINAALSEVLPVLARHDPVLAARLEALIAEADLDPDINTVVPELLQDTRDGLARVQRIISDLRTFSRAESSQRVVQDLARSLDDAIEVFHRECGDAEIVRAYGALPPVAIYPLLLNQVFLNILRNACDAVPKEGGRITISTRVAEDSVLIEFDDNGPGVPVEIRERIFEPFFTTKEVGQGTGLGLAISYQIIEHHQGRIEVLDAPTGGARFRLTLPLAV
jgi:signal transduction histidine kinase